MYVPHTYHSYNYSQHRFPQIPPSSQNGTTPTPTTSSPHTPSVPIQYPPAIPAQYAESLSTKPTNYPPSTFTGNVGNLPPYA
jgi:hypothetical protein